MGTTQMPVQIEYIDGGAGVLWTGTGVVTGRELHDANAEIYSDDHVFDQRYQLVNLVNVERFDVTPEDIREIAAQDRAGAAKNPHIIVAVAGESDLVFGLSRMWEAHVDKSPLKTCVFRTVAEAREWIDTALNDAE